MKFLVIGSGGREHAIVWKLSKSEKVKKIYSAPGNAGISQIAECVDISVENIEGLAEFAIKNNIDYTIVGPEVPLMLGIVDYFEEKGLKIFGPSRDAAIIEGSKNFTKNLLKKYNIPTADFKSFESYEEALKYIAEIKFPVVIKADGLAQGKGVVIAKNREEAKEALVEMMVDKIFGESGKVVVIEEYLEGPEASILAFTDGETVLPMVSAMDYKRVFDENKGPNTGGMGAISPNPYVDEKTMDIVYNQILKPTVEAMKSEGRKFKGVLYAGLMLTEKGPKVLEFNARFGDPETQVILPLLETDLVDIVEAVVSERLNEIKVKWSDKKAVCVVLTSGGYPFKYQTGYEIEGLDDLDGVISFHAGTKYRCNKLVTSGGRVLGLTALGNTYEEAREKVYKEITKVNFEKLHYRKDIGLL